MSDRRLVWAVRLVFYPVALALIAVAWQQHRAGADDGGTAAPAPVVWWTGTTGRGDPATLAVVEGRPRTVRVPLHFACTPELGDVWAVYTERLEVRDGRRVLVRDRGSDTTWDTGWIGSTDVDLGGRYDDDVLTAALSGRMALDANGVQADCGAARVTATFRRPPGRRGTTAQHEWVAAETRDGRVTAFSILLAVDCDDGVGRRLVWEPVLDPGGTLTVTRAWRVVGTGGFVLVAEGGEGSADGGGTASFAVDGDAVRGNVAAQFPVGATTCRGAADFSID
jgi:hypothetical protein